MSGDSLVYLSNMTINELDTTMMCETNQWTKWARILASRNVHSDKERQKTKKRHNEYTNYTIY